MNDFKVGDRVSCIKEYNSHTPVNSQGVIVRINNSGNIGVKWDKHDTMFHNCDGTCEEGHGYYVGSENIQKINGRKKIKKNVATQKYVIVRDSCGNFIGGILNNTKKDACATLKAKGIGHSLYELKKVAVIEAKIKLVPLGVTKNKVVVEKRKVK